MSNATVEMTDEMDGVLREMARRQGIPMTAVLRRAVALLTYLDEAHDRGDQLVLRNPESGAETQIVFESTGC